MSRNPIIRIALTLAALLLVGLVAVATRFVPTDPDIGSWDATTRTYTLTSDVYEPIEIIEGELTLDGDGHSVVGSGTGIGVLATDQEDLVVENLIVEGFRDGIALDSCYRSAVRGNTVSACTYGAIHLFGDPAVPSYDNVVEGNTTRTNNDNGILVGRCSGTIVRENTVSTCLTGINIHCSDRNTVVANVVTEVWGGGINIGYESFDNEVTDNVASANWVGICVTRSSSNIVTANTAESNWRGIIVFNSSHDNEVVENVLTDNTSCGLLIDYNCSGNLLDGNIVSGGEYGVWVNRCEVNAVIGNSVRDASEAGIRIREAHRTIVTENTVASNALGVYVHRKSHDNEIYRNNFDSNADSAFVGSDCFGNVFHLDRPTGGNHWSCWTTPDGDGDGFVDVPFGFPGGQDDLPWTCQDGWETIEAEVDIDPNTINLSSNGNWITAYIELPAGFEPAQIDLATVLLEGTIGAVADPKYGFVSAPGESLVDRDGDGLPERVVKFWQAEVADVLNPGDLLVSITGRIGCRRFAGEVAVRVIARGGKGNSPKADEVTPQALLQSMQVLPCPNPVRDVHTATFRVMGVDAGLVEGIWVCIYDLSGRLVWEREAPGSEVDWHTDTDLGGYLANGVYIYHVRVRIDGTWYSHGWGRVTVLR